MASYCAITPGKVYGPFDDIGDATVAAGVLGVRYDLDAPAAVTELHDWRAIAIEMGEWAIDFDPGVVD